MVVCVIPSAKLVEKLNVSLKSDAISVTLLKASVHACGTTRSPDASFQNDWCKSIRGACVEL